MAKLRVQGDGTGYVDLEAPLNASGKTINLDEIPQLNQNTTFSKDSPEFTIQGTTTQAHLRLESVANTSAWMISNESNADRMRIMHTNTSTSANTFPMYIYEAGYVITPGQPVISGEIGTAMTDPTSGQTIKFGTIRTNKGNIGYSNGRFTVPISGTYRITLNPFFATGAGAGRVYIGINTDTPNSTTQVGHSYRESATYDTGCLNTVIDLAANDYITFYIQGGQLYNRSTDRFNQFSIELIG